MTSQEEYRKGFIDGRKWWRRHLEEINDTVGVQYHDEHMESSPDWNPPSDCEEG